jgi:dipeptidase
MTPKNQSGPNYSDLAKLVLERAHTAREGVILIGALIAEHGHATYGGNSHMIADASECWIVIEFAGGLGLWVAERLGSKSIRVSRPGYIGAVHNSDDFLHSPNFFDYAVSKGWYDPSNSAPFDANLIYGDGKGKWEGQALIEHELLRRAEMGPLAKDDIVWALRAERITGDCAGYGQIVPLIDSSLPELRILWHAHIGPVVAPFVPIFLGLTSVPEEFRQHRYLSASEDQRYYRGEMLGTPSPAVAQEIEARRSATYSFKRLYYLLLQESAEAQKNVAEIWEAFEERLAGEAERVRRTCEILLRCGEHELATSQLTYFCDTELRASLDWADDLVDALDVRARTMSARSGGRPSRTTPQQIW